MNGRRGFAIWITGLPASGKSCLTRELVSRLNREGLYPAVLESDVLRTILTPQPSYQPDERDRFYRQLAQLAGMLASQGIPVILDATANLRSYRDRARALIPRFIEVFVQCPVNVCRDRDPKGIYAAADQGAAMHVPGVDAVYEPPLTPELTVDCHEPSAVNAEAIIACLNRLTYL